MKVKKALKIATALVCARIAGVCECKRSPCEHDRLRRIVRDQIQALIDLLEEQEQQ